MILDHDLRFVSILSEEMFSLLGMDVRFNTVFHQIDGQPEVTIHLLENFLQTAQLPLAEFATNNVINVNTGIKPFYLNLG